MNNQEQWVDIGKWKQYMARMEFVCAYLYMDNGDGRTLEHFIYADNSKSSPVVALRDAIIWAAGGEAGPNSIPHVRFYQEDGTIQSASIDDWYFNFDAGTFNRILAAIDEDPDYNLFDTVLGPDSVIIAKAPPKDSTPAIHWGVILTDQQSVKAYVSDYLFSGSDLEVYFKDQYGEMNQMTWIGESGYFVFDLSERFKVEEYPDGYQCSGDEEIVARNPMYYDENNDTAKWESIISAKCIEDDYILPPPIGEINAQVDGWSYLGCKDFFGRCDNWCRVYYYSLPLYITDITEGFSQYRVEWCLSYGNEQINEFVTDDCGSTDWQAIDTITNPVILI